MKDSRTSADPLGPHGLARLPEELVDLVCSFVRDFEVKGAPSLPSLVRRSLD